MGLHFGAVCQTDSYYLLLFGEQFFGTSWGYPLGPILASPGHHWSDFVDLLEDVRSKVDAKIRFPEQTIVPTTPSTKNKQGLTTNFTDKQFKQIIFTFVVKQSRVSPKPLFFLLKVDWRNSRRDNNYSVH